MLHFMSSSQTVENLTDIRTVCLPVRPSLYVIHILNDYSLIAFGSFCQLDGHLVKETHKQS